MRPKKYPLDPLSRLRAKQVDDAARDLAGTMRAREAAERAEAAARRERERIEAEAQVVRARELAALERGELRVSDLMHGDAWALRASEERAAAELRAIEATQRTQDAREVEQGARDVTARKQADAEVVERDRARWEDVERKRADAKEEEGAAEAWRKRS